MTKKQNAKVEVMLLEDRWAPASFNWSLVGSTATITQVTPSATTIEIDDDGTSISITSDGSTTTIPVAQPNVTYNFLGAETVTIDYDAMGIRAGNVTLNTGVTGRMIDVDGTAPGNGVGGNLTIKAGSGSDSVTVDFFSIGGSLNVDAGLGIDQVSVGVSAFSTIGSNVTITSAELLIFGIGGGAGSTFAGGNVLFNNMSALGATTVTVGNGTFIGGNWTYLGGSGADSIELSSILADSSFVGGQAYLNLGNQLPTDTSVVNIVGGIGTNLTVIGGTLGSESITTAMDSFVGGNINLMLSGALGAGAVDTANILGGMGGDSF